MAMDGARDALFYEVADMIAKVLKIDPAMIRQDSRIAEDLGADSVDAVEILTALEDRYSRTVEDEEILSFKTTGDILDFLSKSEP